MRNDPPESRREKGGATCRAFVRPVNGRKARRTLPPEALVVLDFGSTTYRRLTPEHAERLARELLAAAEQARAELAAGRTPPEPPLAGAAALPAA